MTRSFPERIAIYRRNAVITAVACVVLCAIVRGPGREHVVDLVHSLRQGTNDQAVDILESLILPEGMPTDNYPDGYRGDDPIDALTHTISAATLASDTYFDMVSKGWPDGIASWVAREYTYFAGVGNEALMALAAPFPRESNMDLNNNWEGLGNFEDGRAEALQNPMSRDEWNALMGQMALEDLLQGRLIRNADTDARVYHDPLVDIMNPLVNHPEIVVVGLFTALVLLNERRVRGIQRKEGASELLAAP